MELQRPRKPSTKKVLKERDEESNDSPLEIENNAKKTKNNSEKIEKIEKLEEKLQLAAIVPKEVISVQPVVSAPLEDGFGQKGGIFELLKEQPQPMEAAEQPIYPKLELPLPSSPPLEVSKLQMAYLDPRTQAIESLRLPGDLKEKLTSVTIELEDLPEPSVDSPFYQLVRKYKNETDHLTHTRHSISQEQKESSNYYDKVWEIEDASKTLYATCNDRKQLKESFSWKVAKQNQTSFTDLQASLQRHKEKIYKNFVRHQYSVHVLRLEIQSLLDDFVNGPPFIDFSSTNLSPDDYHARISALLHYLDVLFYFEKSSSIKTRFYQKDNMNGEHDLAQFLTNIKLWLRQLVSAGLYFLSAEQRKTLLTNLITCPSISEWGSNFLYFPERFDEIYHADYFLEVLCIVLKPFVKTLNAAELRSELSSSQFPDWTPVEKIQKDFVLTEEDLNGFLDQFPFGAFVTCVFTRPSSLKSGFDYVNYAVETLSSAIRTCGVYTSFVKRVCKILVDMLHAVTGIVFFGRQNMGETTQQYKFDYLFEKVIKVLKRNPKFGTFAFLPSLPFDFCSRDVHWKILAGLYTFYDANEENFFLVTSADEWSHHVESTNHLRPNFHRAVVAHNNDSPFLLSALGSIAVYWGQQVAVTVLHEIFFLGYLQKDSTPLLQKSCRDVLSIVLEKYPELISVLLTLVAKFFASLSDVMYLYADIPIQLWKPNPETDVKILKSWLLCPLDSVQQKLVKVILQKLSWGPDKKHDELFTGDEFHQKMSLVFFEVYQHHRSAYNQLSVFSMWKKTYTDFFEWIWRILQKTHHFWQGAPRLADYQSDSLILFEQTRRGKDATILLDSVEAFVLYELTSLRKNMFQPSSEFWLSQLLAQKNSECLLRLLYDLIPNLVRQKMAIENKPLFVKIIQSLLVDDQSQGIFSYYFQYHKQTASVPKLLCSMIVNHSLSPPFQDDLKVGSLDVNLPMFAFWFSGMLCLDNWFATKNCCSVLNTLLSAASLHFNKKVLKELQLTLAHFLPKENSESTQSYFGAMTNYLLGPAKQTKEDLILSAEFPWLAFETLYIQTLNSAEKRRISGVDKPSSSEVYFKWMKLCLEIDPAQPLLPCIWQIFCILTLENASHTNSAFRVLHKESLHLENIFKRLDFLSKHFAALFERSKEVYHIELSITLRSMIRWIKEGRHTDIEDKVANEVLKKRFSSLLLLPSNWESRDFLWVELVSSKEIEGQILSMGRLWKDVFLFSPAEDLKPQPPKPELKVWFSGFLEDKQVQTPPPFIPPQPLVELFPIDNLDKFRLLVENELVTLLKATKIFLERMNTHATLELKLIDLIPSLWTSVPRTVQRVQTCSRQCKGPAIFSLQYSESSQNREIMNAINKVLKEINDVSESREYLVTESLALSFLRVKKSLQYLSSHRLSNAKIDSLSVILFTQLSEMYSSENSQYAALQLYIRECLIPLKQVLLSSLNEAQQILHRMLSDTSRVPLLTEYFNPNVNGEKLIALYTSLVYGQMRVPDMSVLVPVAERFHMQSWLLTSPDYKAVEEAIKLSLSAINSIVERYPGIISVEEILGTFIENPSRNTTIVKLIEIHQQCAFELVNYHFPVHLPYAVQVALTFGLTSPTWKVILSSRIEEHLTADIVMALDSICNNAFWKERCELEAKKLSLYSKAENGVNCFGMFLTKVISSKNLLPKNLVMMAQAPAILEFLISVLEPWFSPFNRASKSTTTPWLPSEAVLAQQLLSSSIQNFDFLQKYFPDHCVSHLWGFFVTCFAMNATYFPVQEQKIVAGKFLEFSQWSQLKISPLVVQQCIELLKGLDDTSPFFQASSDILCKAQWDFTQSKVTPQTCLFMFQFGLLLAQKSKPGDNVDVFFQKICSDFDWNSFSTQQFASCLATQDLFSKLFRQLSLFKQQWTNNQKNVDNVDIETMLSRTLKFTFCASGVPQLVAVGINPKTKELIPNCTAKLEYVIKFINEICKNFVGVNKSVAETLSLILDACDQLDLDISSQKELLQRFLGVVNYSHIDLAVVLDPLKKHYRFASVLLSAGGTCIASIPKLCSFTESCLEIHFEHSSSWEQVLQALFVPEIDEILFIKTCIQHAYILTLCAHGFQLNCKKLEESGLALPVVDTILKWLQEMDVYKYAGKEHKLVTFWLLVADMMWQDVRISNSKQRTTQLQDFANSLMKFGEDKKSEGFLGILGFGEKSPFSVKFRICCRLFALFVLSQFKDNGQCRLSPKEPLVMSKIMEKQILLLMDQCKIDKEYSQYASSVGFITSHSLLQNPNKTLDNLSSYVFELACRFYPEHQQIFVKFLKPSV